MPISVSGLTVHTQVGTGTWLDTSGGGGSGTNTDVFLSSTSSRARKVSNSTDRGFALDLGSGTDLSNTVIAQRWTTLAGVGSLDTRANGGVSFWLQDTSGNDSYWDIEGNDTYTGGWLVSAISTSTTESRNSGTAATLTAIRYVGIVWTATGSIGGGDPNCYIDEILSWPDTGLTITGDSTSLVADLQSWDDTNNYGIFETRSEITFSKARLILSPGASDFSSTGERLVFEDPAYHDGTNVSSSLDEIGFESSSSNAIDFTRMLCIAASDPDVTGTSVDRTINFSSATDIGLDTCTFGGFDGATTPVQLGASTNNITSTAFELCGKVSDTGCVHRGGFFRNTVDATGAYVWTTNTDMENTSFESDGTGHGIDMQSAPTDPTTTNFTSILPSNYGANNTADAFIDNNTGHNVLIAALDQTPTELGGLTLNTTTNTSVEKNVAWTIVVSDDEGNAVTGCEITVTDSSNPPVELFHVESSATGTEVYTFNATLSGTDAIILVMKSITDPKEPFSIDTSHPNSTTTTPIQLADERVEFNP